MSQPGGCPILSIEQLRALKGEKRYAEAYRLYRQMEQEATCDVDPEVALIGGQAAKAISRLWDAKNALELCLELNPTGRVLGTARFVLAVVRRELGDTYRAIAELTTWFDGLDQYRELEPLLCGPAHYNRGLAYRQAKQYDESLWDYAAACEAYRKENLMNLLREALQNRAWVSCLLGDAVDGRPALDEARSLCTTMESRWQQKIGEAFLAAIESDPLDRGEKTVCMRRGIGLCQAIYQRDGDDLPRDVRSHAYWLAGRLSLDLGDVETALTMAQRAMQEAALLAVSDSRCLYDAADLLQEAQQVVLK